ncbi:MAG: hypothetical protein MJE66_18695 [Proteobacteria bacterium]|nr:hypothetical protein [Pseudomonadota bacterium]
MEGPAIKGLGLQGTWERVQELIDSGRVAREQVEQRLDPDELQLLGDKIEPSLWYPISIPDKLNRLLVLELFGGDESRLRELGSASAERIMSGDSGIRNFIEGASKHGERAGQVLTGLGPLSFNFGRFEYEGVLDDFTVEWLEAEGLPDSMVHTTCGFLEALGARLAGHAVHVQASRPSLSRVIFRGRPA